MSSKQDKFVRADVSARQDGARLIRQADFDAPLPSNRKAAIGGCADMSWEDGLAARLGAISFNVGKDISVQVTGKSWKQLTRYFKGSPAPAGVLKALTDAAGVSPNYILNGAFFVTKDTEIERLIIDRQIALMHESGDTALADRFRKRAAYLGTLGAALLNRGIAPHSYQEYLRQDFRHARDDIDPRHVAEIQRAFGLREVGKPVPSSDMPAGRVGNQESPESLALSDIVEQYPSRGITVPRISDEPGTDSEPERAPGREVFLAIPRYDLTLSAGDGAFVDRAEVLDAVPFSKGFLWRTLKRSSVDGLILLMARGDSIEPTIGDEDLVMVDMGEKDLQGGLMAFVIDDTAYIKRLRPLIDGGIEIVSDNSDLYPPQRLDRDRLGELRIIGRIKWIGRVV